MTATKGKKAAFNTGTPLEMESTQNANVRYGFVSAVTLSMTTFSITTLSMTIFSITTLSV